MFVTLPLRIEDPMGGWNGNQEICNFDVYLLWLHLRNPIYLNQSNILVSSVILATLESTGLPA